MRWKTNAALALALLLVGGFYYVYEVRWAPDRERAETRKGRVFSAEATDVTGVELKGGEDTVRLTRAGEAWELKSPVVARADRARVEETLTTVLTARVDREIDPKPAALGDFGLDKPAAEVTLTLKDGKTLGLALGNKSPTGVWVYAREAGKPAVVALSDGAMREGESSVLLLPEDVGKAIPRTVGALRDKQVVVLDRDKVTRIDVESPKGAVTLAREKEAWTITAPQALPADQVEAGALLTRLRELRARGFLSDDASAVPRVLAKPTVKLTITEQRKPPGTGSTRRRWRSSCSRATAASWRA